MSTATVDVSLPGRARQASRAWSEAGLERRLAVLQAAGTQLAARRDELHAGLRADGLSADLAQYWGDWLTRAADPDLLRRYAQGIVRWMPAGDGGEILVRRPDGVVLLVPPANSPTINASSVFSILLPGNAVIARAPENDRGMRLMFEEILQPALVLGGFAREVVSIVTAKSRDFLAALASAPEVRTIVFFGNADAGRAVMGEALSAGKKTVMELEGSDHMLVWKDAALDEALESAARALHASTQPCVVPKHFLVHGDVFDRFAEGLAQRVRAATTVEEDPVHGVLVPVRTADRYESAFAEVRELGEVLTGGYRMDGRRSRDARGLYIAPTLMALTSERCMSRPLACFEQEISFPLLPIVRFDGPDALAREQMVELARRSPFGLRASVWAQDPEAIAYFARGLDSVGLVVVNQDHAHAPAYVSPWGGPGRSGGPHGESHFFWEKTSHLQAIACSRLSTAQVRGVLEALGAAGLIER